VRRVAVAAAQQLADDAAGDYRADLEDRSWSDQHHDQSDGRDRRPHTIRAQASRHSYDRLCHNRDGDEL
jgi:hypothetical protein